MLEPNQAPEQEQVSEDAPAIDGGRALQIAYRFLNRRERTVAEMRARLEREPEIPAAEIDAVIAELLEYRYLDDARYALVFTQDKRTLEQWGEERIARGLRERGIEPHLIGAALDQIAEADGESELDRAAALLTQRFPLGPAEFKDRDRAFGVLVRKGYDTEVAADAVRAWAKR